MAIDAQTKLVLVRILEHQEKVARCVEEWAQAQCPPGVTNSMAQGLRGVIDQIRYTKDVITK